ncbi:MULTISPECIES: mechanosensitive channel MscK [Glaesserella]|uniref:Mechanosensitive channel MscK n=1 Tax=Glaesserella australis TaxID=2094024 RepID=A0A328C1B1_9PAST|nr:MULTISPECIES: mechanosensitive channel MscK [Glaesserella]AUI65780.1 mechanosensitive channel MscK [Glaesserella sp. 15-184]RAL19557.1 mechanosensitive channel MscK [Glaesserella australis]
MFKKSFWLAICLSFFSVAVQAAPEDVISADDLKLQLDSVKADTSGESTQLAKNLEGAIGFLEKAKKQEQDLVALQTKVADAPKTLNSYQQSIAKLTEDLKDETNRFTQLETSELEKKQDSIHQELNTLQAALNEVNASLTTYRSATEQTRKQTAENNQQAEKLTRWKYNSKASKSLIDKYNAELKFIDANNKYNLYLGQNVDLLLSVDEAKRSELTLKQQILQKQLTDLQEVLNANRLKAYEAQAKQAEELKANNKVENPLIHDELSINTDLSQFLVEQTQKANTLSRDNLRAKNVLDSLTQTQRNIEEQISALQGTLVLSRIINQQKQALPTESLIKGLANDIANLRVEIFNLSQSRDELYNINNVISKIETTNKVLFDDNEKKTLTSILTEREKIIIDLIKTLNLQLNLSNEIEATQRQIITISDNLQNQLQQQSFWVKSNNPIDLSWLETFPKQAIAELAMLTRYLGFENLGENLPSTLAFIGMLLLIYGAILWKKPAIKARLAVLNSQINTLKNDSHWHSPEAMLWTIILALPSGLMFLVIATVVLYLFFPDPLAAWGWVIKAVGYWLFFATILSLLRPNGLAYRHFGMPQTSNEIFQRIIKQSVWIVVLLLVSSIFSQVEVIGFTNDVIGQVVTIVALALCTFVVRPLLDRGIQEYENAKTEDGKKRSVSLFKLLRFVLFIVPLTLIVLIILGYYYTAVYLIEHIIKTYLVALVWVFGRYFAYRSLTISSRRMAYRRLQKKREKLREQNLEQNKEEPKDKPEEVIKISTVNEQIFRMADLIGWVVLFVSLYAIWSDLISIAYYLNNVILWEQVETTSKGTVVESVTLLNILRSILYVTITYVLVKNIKGILEVTFFSRLKLSKGTPHTITAVLTYFIVCFGSISAFSALGISWSKIQWVFTALSVGLGFGVREIFGSFVSGTILLFERPIRVGDKVTVGNFTGVITRIRLRSTTLVDDEHKEVVLPNQAFVTDRFINWTYNNTITRLQIIIKISTEANLELVRNLLFQVASEAPKVMEEPSPNVNLVGFGDGWIEHEFTVYVPELDDRSATRNFLYKRITELFNQHHIKIAFNQMDVHLHQPQEKRRLIKSFK